jgi:predicted MFS family arabinose efflux permease
MHDAWAKRRTRNLVAIDVLVLAASVVGILSQIAKDHPSTAEGTVWVVSVAAFGLAVVGLLALIAVWLGRLARRVRN